MFNNNDNDKKALAVKFDEIINAVGMGAEELINPDPKDSLVRQSEHGIKLTVNAPKSYPTSPDGRLVVTPFFAFCPVKMEGPYQEYENEARDLLLNTFAPLSQFKLTLQVCNGWLGVFPVPHNEPLELEANGGIIHFPDLPVL